MTLRNRLTWISSSTFGIVFTISSILVYSIFYSNSEKIIFNELEKTCMLTAIFYLEEDELPQKEHNIVRERFEESIQNAKVKIFNEDNELSFGDETTDIDSYITADILDKVRQEKKINFKKEDTYFYGIFYPDNQGDFVVFIVDSNEFFQSQSNQLLVILLVSLLTGLIIIFIVSRYLSNIAYRPISSVIEQVNNIQTESLDTKLISPNTSDELQDLIETFNKLLQRLSDTFIIQKNFINYVSHEFKTPLASISGNLEVFAQKERNKEEYQEVAENVLKNVYEIEEILNNLMLLSGLRSVASAKEKFRVDELVWSVLDKVYQQYPQASSIINLDMQVEDTQMLEIKGSSGQIEIGIFNLIENAVKYSKNNPIKIILTVKENGLTLVISDKGRGIIEKELKHISQPFYRGSNVGQVKGSGIGLSLAILIFKQNNVGFSITSEENVGTKVKLTF